MDIVISTTLAEVASLLQAIGIVDLRLTHGTLDARMPDRGGRFHVLGVQAAQDETYLDVHWDPPIHFLFFGVDYRTRPFTFGQRIILEAGRRGFQTRVTGGESWFSRRNKAIFRGIRL